MDNTHQVRVLVIDDSAYNRRAVSGFLEEVDGVEVVGKASDGQEGLQLALTEQPDVITLDLEMPRMDGFSFLRLLMSRRPTPVIVISSHAEKENVFRALELGALDFVAKPTKRISPQIQDIREQVVRKVLMAKNLKREAIKPLPQYAKEPEREDGRFSTIRVALPRQVVPEEQPQASRVAVIAASTGGPAAITRVLTALPSELETAIIIAQHMPPRFTATFAERLDRQCALKVVEVSSPMPVRNGWVFLAPGDRCVELVPGTSGMSVRSVAPDQNDRYTPSADRLFTSAAICARKEALAIVLTGMGDDGKAGVQAISESGGLVVVESEETAVVAGMPLAAQSTGTVARVERLERMADLIQAFSKGY
ncbi:MAG: chemotaxis-specific protein-glutamate methyltransferase CheB [Deltaproteobacteria bacterium]|nr:chemotaxis-specific protein-glutamate methyltransferase CheB [Deltaproteobacteria bacterium]